MHTIFALFILGVSTFLKCAITQDFYWRDFTSSNIPYDAVESYEGKYIGQVVYNGNILPATIYSHRPIPAVTFYNRRIDIKNNIKILCSLRQNRLYWQRVYFTSPDAGQLKNAIKGGYQLGYNLYIGRMYHEGEWKIGKVIGLHNKQLKGLWIWNHKGESAQIQIFDLLKYNTTFM